MERSNRLIAGSMRLVREPGSETGQPSNSLILAGMWRGSFDIDRQCFSGSSGLVASRALAPSLSLRSQRNAIGGDLFHFR